MTLEPHSCLPFHIARFDLLLFIIIILKYKAVLYWTHTHTRHCNQKSDVTTTADYWLTRVHWLTLGVIIYNNNNNLRLIGSLVLLVVEAAPVLLSTVVLTDCCFNLELPINVLDLLSECVWIKSDIFLGLSPVLWHGTSTLSSLLRRWLCQYLVCSLRNTFCCCLIGIYSVTLHYMSCCLIWHFSVLQRWKFCAVNLQLVI